MTSGSQRLVIELRDPVHGGVPVRQGELRVIDTPLFHQAPALAPLHDAWNADTLGADWTFDP